MDSNPNAQVLEKLHAMCRLSRRVVMLLAFVRDAKGISSELLGAKMPGGPGREVELALAAGYVQGGRNRPYCLLPQGMEVLLWLEGKLEGKPAHFKCVETAASVRTIVRIRHNGN